MKSSIQLLALLIALCSSTISSAFQAQPILRNNRILGAAAYNDNNKKNMGKKQRKRGRPTKSGTSLQQALPSASYGNANSNKNSDASHSNKQKQESSSTSSTQLSAASLAMQPSRPFQIFCDLDGVLCDFDKGVRSLSNGIAANDLPVKRMWRIIGKADRFYERLAWTRDGRKLWESIRPHQPNILTGISRGPSCPSEKASWCSRELGVETNHVCKAADQNAHKLVTGNPKEGVVNVITCWSRNKHYESGEKAVLIDDRIALAADWVSKGGIFIHHTDTERTLKQLREHGIIDNDEATEQKPEASL